MRQKKSKVARGFKKLNCKYCGTECPKVDVKADRITCFRCVQKLVNGEYLEPKS